MATGAIGTSDENIKDISDAGEPDEWEYAGLEAIDRACNSLYPEQPNPLQASAVINSWFGGPDPLDYIRIYSNHGDIDKGIPPHWHYVSCGFSDLHGDGRVHQFKGSEEASGYGFELTLRLKKSQDETSPPMWPTVLMNRLANYVFDTGNTFHIGDHIPWHKPLDCKEGSVIQHMLVAQDPQLSTITSNFGFLNFIQLVGVTGDEMKAAQRWKGTGVLELLATSQLVTPYFITDMDRKQSIFEVDSSLMSQVEVGINADGSNLGHVTSVCLWTDIKDKLCDSIPASCDNDDELEAVCLDGVHLMFDSEAAGLLPMVIRGRLQKGKFFVFHNAEDHSIHLIPPDFHDDSVFVNQAEPLKAIGTYLQIYCSQCLLEKMSQELECLLDNSLKESQHYPKEFRFSDPTIVITVSLRGETLAIDKDVHNIVDKNRLQRGTFFMFRNVAGQCIKLIPPYFHDYNTVVNQAEPLVAQRDCLQIYCSHSLLKKMSHELESVLENSESQYYPVVFRLSDPTIVITVSTKNAN